ncbi:hypothetical protein PVT67_06895 [Gallaecimonas kandeliae]|uniref:hypothetical protein n=1 Tax=Gallaecimonas kandeliae TaxID=3029055 RepID=UPI0026477CE9|nr:hypothetical protein [Gallaecimonas kandeliae]WKE66957.1 hypothetical protein PVT67_06895 [Gallaecimonas kandeliae]
MKHAWIAALLALAGCSHAENPAGTAKLAPQPAKVQEVKVDKNIKQPVVTGVISTDGKVIFLPMEGGFFGIVGDDGHKWLPMGLPANMRRHNLRVHVEGRPDPKMMTIQQWGTPLHITQITVLDDKDAVDPNAQY